jgi:NAD(P)-dependent dehydrogenase (short-subunit alcohol dehydrogenase family)
MEVWMSTYDFSNKVAIVTGAGSGIGEACALTFARGGAKVVVADYDEEGGRRVVDVITGEGGTAQFVSVDVSKAEQVELMVATTVSTYGGLHVAVNNAGIGGAQAPTGEYPLDSWRQVLGVNLDGVFYGMRYQLPAMLVSGGGSIINMASILGNVGFANSPAYVAAKHGVVGLTKSAAIEYSAQGVRINSVGPGFIRTPLLDENLDEATMGAIAGMHPIQRLGTSQEVADLVAFLSSDEASFCTGGYYLVDGAYTAQ